MITTEEILAYREDFVKIHNEVRNAPNLPGVKDLEVTLAIFQAHRAHCAQHINLTEGRHKP